MDRRPKAPRVYTGYGSGAATPEPVPTPEPKPQRSWQPTVSRGRTTTTIPQQDLNEAKPRTPVRVSKPATRPVAAAPRVQAPTPDMDPAVRSRTTSAATAARSGVGNFYSRTMTGVDSAMERAAAKVPTKPLRSIFKQNVSSYRGGLGKVMLLGDAQAFVEGISQIANPDATAELIYNARPQDYASIDEVKQEVQAYNAGETAGIVLENVAQGMILTAGIFATLTGVWAVAVPMIALIAATTAAQVISGSAAQDPTAANILMQNPNAIAEAKQNEGKPEPGIAESVAGSLYYTHGGPIAGIIGTASRDQFTKAFRDNMAALPKQNSREEVNKMRQDRGILGEIDGTYNDFASKLTLYKSFGERENEVSLALTTGYFMTPTGYTLEVPDGNGGYQEIREFELDYPKFITWFEDTDWLESRSGLVQRVAKLPGVSPVTQQAHNEAPISPLEARYALKFWYDYYNEQQAAP